MKRQENGGRDETKKLTMRQRRERGNKLDEGN
jgi:hypothetical protein